MSKDLIAYDQGQVALIKETVAKGASDNELAMFLHQCKITGLDPLARQIYWIGRRTKQPDGSYKTQGTIQTSIDGFRLIADRSGKYAPGDIEILFDKNGEIEGARAFVSKKIDGDWMSFSAVAYFIEYVPLGKDGKPSGLWGKMPRHMIGKCAEALALRRAFPAELSGVYTSDEMMQADSEGQRAPVDATPKKTRPVITEKPKLVPPPAPKKEVALKNAITEKLVLLGVPTDEIRTRAPRIIEILGGKLDEADAILEAYIGEGDRRWNPEKEEFEIQREGGK